MLVSPAYRSEWLIHFRTISIWSILPGEHQWDSVKLVTSEPSQPTRLKTGEAKSRVPRGGSKKLPACLDEHHQYNKSMSYLLGIVTYGVGVLLTVGYLLAWKWGNKAKVIADEEAYKTMMVDD